jgi:hypothetical protein
VEKKKVNSRNKRAYKKGAKSSNGKYNHKERRDEIRREREDESVRRKRRRKIAQE